MRPGAPRSRPRRPSSGHVRQTLLMISSGPIRLAGGRHGLAVAPLDGCPENRLRTGAMRCRWRTLVVVMIAVVAAVGCGDDSSPSGGSRSSTTSGAVRMRTVQTPAGPVQVPVAPRRVVAVDYYSLPDLLEVGYTPVGVPTDLGDTL